jgi:hypothetical protein
MPDYAPNDHSDNRPAPAAGGDEPFTWSNPRRNFRRLDTNQFDRIGWFAGVGTFVLALTVYAATMCRTVFWWDSGELVANASILGIPHRPGFPFYILAARIFGFPPLGDYFTRINFFSVFCAAAAAGIFCYVLIRLLARYVERDKVVAYAALLAVCALIGNYTFWIQAVRTEVYALNGLVVAVLFLLLERADSAASSSPRTATKCIYAAAFIFGLGLGGHHATLASTAPALALLAVMIMGRRIFRPGSLVTLGIMLILGFSVYLYLPLRASQSPLLNWGWDNASLADGAQVVMATDAYGYISAQTFLVVGRKLLQALNLIVDQIGLPLSLFALVGIIFWIGKSRRWGLFFLAITVGNLLIVALLATEFIDWNADLHGYLLPTLAAALAGIGCGFYLLLRTISRLLDRLIPSHHLRLTGKTALVGVAVMLAITPAIIGGPFCDLSDNRLAWDLGLETLIDLPPGAVIVMDGVNWDFVLRGMQFVANLRPDIAIVNRSLLPAQWYQQQCRRRYPAIFATTVFPVSTKSAEVIAWADDLRAAGLPIFWEYTERELPSYNRFQPAGHLYYLTEPDSIISDSALLAQEHFERTSRFFSDIEELNYDYDAQGVYIQNLYRAGLYYERWGLIYRAREMYQRALTVRPAEGMIWGALLRLEHSAAAMDDH